jgi:EmrB/QacA subfamily drug resistance transporter
MTKGVGLISAGQRPCDEAVILSGPCQDASQRNGRWVLAATVLGSSMEFIDGTVVNVALPALQRGLGASGAQVQWVIEAYALFLSALLLVGGSLGDRYGLRKIYTIGIVIFAVASMWCGIAPTIGQLIAARALQGVGGAMLVPNSLALVSAHFPPQSRGKAIGIWSGFASITMASGPVVGGWLVQHGSWRWAFFINAPLAMIAVTIVLLKVPEVARTAATQRLDWPGTVLAVCGLSSVTYALIEWTQGSHVVEIMIAGLLMLGAFFWVEKRSSYPMMPLSLFENRSFLGANLLTFFLYAAIGGALFYLPLNLIQVQGYTPTHAGAAIVPLAILMFLLSRWSGGLLDRYGPRLPLTLGPLIAAAGYAMLARTSMGGSYWTTYFPAIVLLGLGMSISVAPLTTVVMSSVEGSRTGAASGINNAVSQVAGLLALAAFAPIFFHVFSPVLTKKLEHAGVSSQVVQQVQEQRTKLAAIETNNPQARLAIDEAFVAGFRVVCLIAAGLAVASAASAAVTMKSRKQYPVED